MDAHKAVLLAAQIAQRRIDLIGLFGQAAYDRQTEQFKPLIRREAERACDGNPIKALPAVCKEIDRTYRDGSNETRKQYALCAALELFEQ